jgi:hypothetical protein
MIGLLTNDEESNSVIGIDFEEGVHVGSDVFEDEHDIVPMVQVSSLVVLDCLLDLLLFLHLLLQLL